MVDKQNTYNKVITIVTQKLNQDKETIVQAHSFQDLGVDSLDMVEIIMELEEQFNIEINDEDAEKLTNLTEVVTYIHALRTKN